MLECSSVELILVSLTGTGSDFVLFVAHPSYLTANTDGNNCKRWIRLVIYSGLKYKKEKSFKTSFLHVGTVSRTSGVILKKKLPSMHSSNLL